jgi:uncharacterized membrane protein YciS (DUF1049 family)
VMLRDDRGGEVFTYPRSMLLGLVAFFIFCTVTLGIRLMDILGLTDWLNESDFGVSTIICIYLLVLLLFIWLLRSLSMRIHLTADRIAVSKWFLRKKVALDPKTHIRETSDGRIAMIVISDEKQTVKVNHYIAKYETFVHRLHELAPGNFTGEHDPLEWPIELKNYTRGHLAKVGPLMAALFLGIAAYEFRGNAELTVLVVCIAYALFMLGWTAWLLLFDMRWVRFHPNEVEINRGGKVERHPISALEGLRWKTRSSGPGSLEVEVNGKKYDFPVRVGSKESLRVLFWQLRKAYGVEVPR